MTLKEKIAYSRKRPKTYVEERLPQISFCEKDDIEEVICLMMATAYQDMPEVFYKLLSMVEGLPDLNERLDYLYYYHLSLASFYKHSGDSANAIEHCLRSNDIAYRMNDNCGIVQSYRFISSVYLTNKDYDNAIYYSVCAIKELAECDDYELAANVYNIHAVILVDLEQYDYAIQAYENAMEAMKQANSYEEDMLYYLLHLNFGEVYMLKGDMVRSEKYYLRAIELSDLYDHDYTFSDMLLILVDYYKQNKNFEKACYYYDKYHNRGAKTEPVGNLLKENKDKEAIKDELSQMKRLRDTNQILLKRLTQLQTLNDKNHVKINFDLENRLTEALSKGEIVTYYQGKWSLEKNRVVGAEALIRWQDGNSLVPPVAFIPHVEDTELIIELSKKVIQDSIRVCKEITQYLDPNFVISVNITPYQLEHQDLVRFIQGELFINNLEAKHIEIEITERSFINQTPNIIDQLRRLQELGVALSLDDFGTGYSSLAYINDYHFDCIKLDKSLINNVVTDRKAFGLLSGIVNMFQTIKVDTVVEGVETLDQVRLLESLGCNFLQGYYYNRPVEEDKFKSAIGIILKEDI